MNCYVMPCQEKITQHAATLLDRLFRFFPQAFSKSPRVNILAIGTGTFPSFIPFVNLFSRIYPHVKQLNFHLVEPKKFDTDFFMHYFSQLTRNELKNEALIEIKIWNTDIRTYLKNNTHIHFDIIYFEHPHMDILKILLGKEGIACNDFEVSLRESIPYLQDIANPDALIVASFIFKNELREMKSLLNFSLPIKPFFIDSPHLFSNGRFFSSGFIGKIKKMHSSNKPSKKLAKKIRTHNNYFCIFFTIAFILLCVTFISTKLTVATIISMIFMLAQLFYHRYGMHGIIIKIVFIVGQLLALFGLEIMNIIKIFA